MEGKWETFLKGTLWSCINQNFGENKLAIRLNIILLVVKLIELNEQNIGTMRTGDNNRGVG